jgi:hypothetical protein
MPSPKLAAAANAPTPDDARAARRQAALARLRVVGEGLCPALMAGAEASLANAFGLTDLLFQGRRNEEG